MNSGGPESQTPTETDDPLRSEILGIINNLPPETLERIKRAWVDQTVEVIRKLREDGAMAAIESAEIWERVPKQTGYLSPHQRIERIIKTVEEQVRRKFEVWDPNLVVRAVLEGLLGVYWSRLDPKEQKRIEQELNRHDISFDPDKI